MTHQPCVWYSKHYIFFLMKKNNTWNIRCLDDELFVPATLQPIVSYWRLSNFKISKGQFYFILIQFNTILVSSPTYAHNSDNCIFLWISKKCCLCTSKLAAEEASRPLLAQWFTFIAQLQTQILSSPFTHMLCLKSPMAENSQKIHILQGIPFNQT